MRNIKLTTGKILSFISIIFLTGNLNAQIILNHPAGDGNVTNKQFSHTINMCPFGIAFGIYSANYEYLIDQTHGIDFRFDYEDVPKTYSDANIESYGRGFVFNYRYHLNKKMESFYVGAFSRYRDYKGEGTANSQKFDFTLTDITVGMNVGKRWVWDSGLTVNFTLGYGYSFDKRSSSHSSSAVTSAIDDFENGYDFINPFLGELSFGYAF